MAIPSVFISYSHDTQEHKKWVLDLATRLRTNGVDAALDQWDLQPGDDLPHFMEQNLASADYVLMICTDNYVQKANSGAGGVGYEKMIITSNLLANIDSNKIIPIIRQEGGSEVPTFLKTKLYINFSRDDEFEFSFDELIRTLQKAPLYKKPEISNNPFEPITEGKQEKTNDAVYELMKVVVGYFESGSSNYVEYEKLLGRVGKSRIMLDMALREAKDKGLVTQSDYGGVYLTDKGKYYAAEHRLDEV
ncbi:MAG: toll/interleukin-1 receptor domain-containing protein [Candidatus Thiodiazotropha endolucinida]